MSIISSQCEKCNDYVNCTLYWVVNCITRSSTHPLLSTNKTETILCIEFANSTSSSNTKTNTKYQQKEIYFQLNICAIAVKFTVMICQIIFFLLCVSKKRHKFHSVCFFSLFRLISFWWRHFYLCHFCYVWN